MAQRARAFNAVWGLLGLWAIGRIAHHALMREAPSMTQAPPVASLPRTTPFLERFASVRTTGQPPGHIRPIKCCGTGRDGQLVSPEQPPPKVLAGSAHVNLDPADADPGDPEPAAPAPSAARATIRPWLSSLWVVQRAGAPAPVSMQAGQYGGSQLGLRLVRPIDGLPKDTALNIRFSSDTPAFRDAEAALGIAYRPIRDTTLDIIVEARLPLHQRGALRPAILAAGGWQRDVRGDGPMVQGYVQAGLVGMRDPIAFVDGHTSLRWPVSNQIQLGAGLWGGAQGRIARLDIGPSIQIVTRDVHISLDWRVRIAGQAQPGSGPSLTLGKDF